MIVENKFTGRQIGKKQTKVRMFRKENVGSPIRKKKLKEGDESLGIIFKDLNNKEWEMLKKSLGIVSYDEELDGDLKITNVTVTIDDGYDTEKIKELFKKIKKGEYTENSIKKKK